MERDKEIQRKITQALLVTKIKNLGVNKIEITFSGSGDSGDIDEVQFIANEWDDITSDITSKIGDDCIDHFRELLDKLIP